MIERTTRTPSEKIGPDVLRAATELLNEQGARGLTVRAVALRADVAPMAIYNHFEGMNGLIEALWVGGFEALQRAQTIETDDPIDDLLKAAVAYRDFAIDNPGLYTVMFMHRFKGFEPSIAAAHVAAGTFQSIATIVERCQAKGAFASMNSRDAAQVLWSSCHGYVALEMLGINFATDCTATFTQLLLTLRDGFL